MLFIKQGFKKLQEENERTLEKTHLWKALCAILRNLDFTTDRKSKGFKLENNDLTSILKSHSNFSMEHGIEEEREIG